jgi:hypothetical protein
VWRTRTLRIATAATILLALLGAAALVMRTRPALAFADVARRVDATRTVRAVVVDPREGGTLLSSGKRMRFEGAGAIVIADAATGQEVMLETRTKSAYRIPQRAVSRAMDFYGVFRELAGAASTPIEKYVDKAGRQYPGLQGKCAVKIGDDAIWNVEAKVWSEPATKLPVRMEIRPTGGEGQERAVLLEQIEFDVSLDDTLFDMTIPSGYTVVGLTSDKLKPPPSAQEAAELTIVPGVGIGRVKFGMSREQIVTVLGEPEFTMHDSYLCYPSKGLQLVLVGREPDKLGTIIANPSDAASATRNEFLGQTDKGIRMGSSEKQVRDAYGEPDPPLPSDKDLHASVKLLRYDKLGIMFSFVDDRLGQIFATRTH